MFVFASGVEVISASSYRTGLLQIAVANDMDLSHPFVNSPQHQVGAVLRVPSPYLRYEELLV